MNQPKDDYLGQAALAALTLATAACSGGGSTGTGSASAPPPTAPLAARFLAQAATGASRADITEVQQLGFEGWLEKQFAMPRRQRLFDWMVSKGFVASGIETDIGADNAIWYSLIGSNDTLRQRVAFALSQIFVASIAQPGAWKNFAAAHYFDLL